MNIVERGVVLTVGLLLVTGITACSNASSPTEETRDTTPSPAPTSEGGEYESGSLFGAVSGLNNGTPTAKPAVEAPTAQLQPASSDIVMGSYVNNTGLTATYWASDWCHYFIGNDGVTYGDTCVRSVINTDGTISTVQFLIYRYDPTKVDSLGNLVLELYVGYPGYTTYRDLTDPLFNQVQWAAFPTGIANITADTFMVSFLDDNGQLVWYSTQQILDMAVTARTNANVPQSTVPSWDPAITVWSYSMISSINNQIASIPGAAY